MNKTQLLTTLSENFYKVGTPNLIKDLNGIKRYTVSLTKKVDDSMRIETADFYVEDEGGAGEAAYYGGNNPVPTPPVEDTILNQIDTKIDELLTAGTILGVVSKNYNKAEKNGIITVIFGPAGSAVKKEVFVYLDGSTVKYSVLT